MGTVIVNVFEKWGSGEWMEANIERNAVGLRRTGRRECMGDLWDVATTEVWWKEARGRARTVAQMLRVILIVMLKVILRASTCMITGLGLSECLAEYFPSVLLWCELFRLDFHVNSFLRLIRR